MSLFADPKIYEVLRAARTAAVRLSSTSLSSGTAARTANSAAPLRQGNRPIPLNDAYQIVIPRNNANLLSVVSGDLLLFDYTNNLRSCENSVPLLSGNLVKNFCFDQLFYIQLR